MKNLTCYSIILIAVGFMACNTPQADQSTEAFADTQFKATDTTVGPASVHTNSDTAAMSFFQSAAYGDMTAVESSSKIQQSTSNQEINIFAAMMIEDHGKANQELKALATQKGYTLPKRLPDSKLDLINKLDSFKDEGRNEYYVQLMINEHKNAINLFSLAEHSQDKEISKLASTTLPVIKQHYQNILKIDTLIKKPRANQGDDPLKISDRKKQ